MKNTIREAISFGRFSSGEQEKGDSTSRQERAYQSVCERYKDKMIPSTRFKFGSFFGKGESGFHAAHLAQGGSLRRFLDKIQSGEIDPHKTVLVIEMWSRFARIAPDLAVKLLSDIVRAGCVIAVYTPDMWVDTSALSGQQFIMIAMCLQMAHVESSEKSRIKKSDWQKKREYANGMTKNGLKSKDNPAWISVSEDGKKFVLNELASKLHKAALLSIDGMGQGEIEKRISGLPKNLTRTFRDRALIGEKTMKERHGKERKTAKVVEGFYDAVLTVDEFRKVNAALDSRMTMKAKKGRFVTNLFTGLIKNTNGQEMAIKRQSQGKPPVLVPYANGRYQSGKSLHYQPLEDALISLFIDLKISDVMAVDSGMEQKQIAELRAKIEDKKATIKVFEDDGNLSVGQIRSIGILEKQIADMTAQVEQLETKIVVGEVDNLGNIQSIVAMFLKIGNEGDMKPELLLEYRTKLKDSIRRLVSKIQIAVHDARRATIKVWLVNGAYRGGQLTPNGAKLEWRKDNKEEMERSA
jgi:hypothetical protein